MPAVIPSIGPYVWDTSLTNASSVPTSGHLANGFGNSETPASSEENNFRNNYTSWIAAAVSGTEVVNPASVAGTLISGLSLAGNQVLYSPTGASTFEIPVQTRKGAKITAVRAYVTDSATGPTRWNMGVFVGGSAVGTTQVSSGSGTAQVLTATLTGVTTAGGSLGNLSVTFYVTSGTATIYLSGLEVDWSLF